MSCSNIKSKYHYYVYDLPFHERKMLCSILDMNEEWEILAGAHMKFDNCTIYRLRQAVIRKASPTDELLNHWGTQNHTVLELFGLLSRMRHYQAMSIIKPFVDPKYHYLIYEGKDNLTPFMSLDVSNNSSGCTKSDSILNTKKQIDKENMNNHVDSMPTDYHRLQAQKFQLSPIEESNSLANERDNGVRKSDKKSQNESKPESCVPMISFKELEVATNNWDKNNILGRGGFGVVYKGTWMNTCVAIKKLEPQKGNEVEFNLMEAQKQQSLKELRYLNSYRHDNILQLFGYSLGGDKPCLVYQFMINGSLEDRLLCRQGTKPLNWSIRHKIANGAARGLQFLHGMEKPLVHGDIKSANILLDPHFEPRLGDFGLAKEGPMEQYTHVKVSKVHGTRPYLPDEFLRGKKFSTKVDTYSFGVVLFEVATGLRAYDEARPQKLLKDFVDGYDESRLTDLMDTKAGMDETHTFPGIIALGKLCVKSRPRERPDMDRVFNILSGMMTARDMAVKAQNHIRHGSLTPSNPYELQLLFDQYSRRASLSPMGSYLPHLFYSPAVTNQPLDPQRRSPSPTPPTASQGYPVAQTPVAVTGAANMDIKSTADSRISPISVSITSPSHPSYPPPPYINVFPPSNTVPPHEICNSAVDKSAISTTTNPSSTISSDENYSEEITSSEDDMPEELDETPNEEGNICAAPISCEFLPDVSELCIKDDTHVPQ